MNRYKVTKQLGDGTYGSVLKAVNRQTGEIVRNLSLCLNSKIQWFQSLRLPLRK